VKLFDAYRERDYGIDAYLTIGQFKNFNLLDASFHSSDYWNWEPNIQLSMSVFGGSVFSFAIEVLSFSLSMSLVPYRFPMNLSHTREL
jgi:hypothetical protein